MALTSRQQDSGFIPNPIFAVTGTPADDPPISDEILTEEARSHFDGIILVGRDLMEIQAHENGAETPIIGLRFEGYFRVPYS